MRAPDTSSKQASKTLEFSPLPQAQLKLEALKILRLMQLSRFTDEKMAKLVKQNKGGSFHMTAAGHEMIGALFGQLLVPGKDWALPYYRDQPVAISWGCDLSELLGVSMGRAVSHHSAGRMMPLHFSHKALHLPCQSSVVGSQFLQAVGLAKGLRLLGKDEVVYVSAGDGATSQGDFYEALNFAALHKLSVIFCIQDNGWAISVPVGEQTAGGSIYHIVKDYPGMEVFSVDGTNYLELREAVASAVARGRRAEGPSLVHAKVPRMGPHSNSDDPKKYQDAETMQQACSLDPIPRFIQWLLAQKLATEAEVEVIRAEAFEEVEAAAVKAEQYPFPEKGSGGQHVYAEVSLPVADYSLPESSPAGNEQAIVISEALQHALDEEMQRDPGVVVFGQDVAHGKGGVFGITMGLTKKHGDKRCFNTPLAESTIMGLALGMSLDGVHRPVAEIQFADYIWTGISQLFNEISSYHYRSAGEWNLPLVIRMPYGGYIQGGPYHSQSIESFLAHCPGLKVVIPSNAADAKGLMKMAIRDPNPVIFLEHKGLYRQRVFCARQEPSEDYVVPFGQAKVVREGTDITLVGWGMMIFMAVQLADKLAQEGLSVEVIDLRTIVPMDIETILTSVRKTGKLLIAHEAPRNCGVGAEIAARVTENAFEYLDAPIARVCGLDAPVPYCKQLENEVLPQPEDLEQGIRRLYEF